MIKLAIIFGGKSTEHDISLTSATSIINNLNKDKYNIYPIYIDKQGTFNQLTLSDKKEINLKEEITKLTPIPNIIKYLENIDIVFPILHGKYGEDGTIQGMLELIDKKYVGCKTLSSSLCMDKIYTKILVNSCGINTTKSINIKKYKDTYIYLDNNFNKTLLDKKTLKELIKEELNYPIFIKPSNSGSSVGVYKIKKEEDLIPNLEKAFLYDNKVLIEEAIIGREVECAIIGNEEPIASPIGEVLSASDFYSYDSKYNNKESKTIIPATLDKNISNKIKDTAIKAYTACDCKGLSRVDFFIEKNTNRIILNEINTMPGFTEISMYPKLIEQLGYSYSDILDKLIDLAFKS